MHETDDETTDPDQVRKHTPGGGVKPAAHPIDPNVPEEFGLVQAWWGNGKGKTTAAMGMGFRAAGHGYRVHMLQLMKGGADSVEAVRGEYNAIESMPGFSYENLGHYGWHGMQDGSKDDSHKDEAQAGYSRAEELLRAAAAADLTGELPLDAPPEDGMHLLILDEILYAADRELIDPADVITLIEKKPEHLELVMTGSHNRPEYLLDHADLVTNVRKEKHPIDEGQRGRKGTEF
ncbi:cob(I)yrinic acid a,c-diamide adenosyltransferase [Halocatena marina]|uniref:cob(I)yrinic acid a,c-diamide adenosyltransferase n=1 Tax=Halocatena marina TaxID=2934937 RepID=UPI0020108A74|nr:cob(I)yrinic acid a,c-diamide adenosyltransferase [Halocatena marina]